MNGDNLATELLHEIKRTSKRNFILFIITLVMLFVTNALWLYAWTLCDKLYPNYIILVKLKMKKIYSNNLYHV